MHDVTGRCPDCLDDLSSSRAIVGICCALSFLFLEAGGSISLRFVEPDGVADRDGIVITGSELPNGTPGDGLGRIDLILDFSIVWRQSIQVRVWSEK